MTEQGPPPPTPEQEGRERERKEAGLVQLLLLTGSVWWWRSGEVADGASPPSGGTPIAVRMCELSTALMNEWCFFFSVALYPPPPKETVPARGVGGLHPVPFCSTHATPFLCSAKRASGSHKNCIFNVHIKEYFGLIFFSFCTNKVRPWVCA